MKSLSVILAIILSLCITCNQKSPNNTMCQESDTSIIIPLAPKDAEPIILNRPLNDNDIDSFMTYRTPESFKNLVIRYGKADTMNELLFYSIVAADKFKMSRGYYNIAGCITNYFSYMSIGNYSTEIAVHYLIKGLNNKDKSCLEVYESLDKHLEKEIGKLWIPEKHKENPIVVYKANSLKGNIDDYNQLKKYLIEKDKPEDLLFYSYIMADRYGYEPARNDVVDAMNRGYKKYGLGKMGQDAKYFCSFFQEKHEN